MRIITDGRKLRHLAKKFNFEYDKKYKYIISDGWNNWHEFSIALKKYGYAVKYFDGCFNPFIVEL